MKRDDFVFAYALNHVARCDIIHIVNPSASTTFDWYIPCYQKLQKFYIMLYTRSFILPFILKKSFERTFLTGYSCGWRPSNLGLEYYVCLYISTLAIWYTYVWCDESYIDQVTLPFCSCSKSLVDNCDQAYKHSFLYRIIHSTILSLTMYWTNIYFLLFACMPIPASVALH